MRFGKGVLVIGAGGHAKVVLATLEAAGVTVAAVLDDDQRRWKTDLLGVPIAGPVDRVGDRTHPAVIAIGDNSARRTIAERHADVDWLTVAHPRAWLAPTVQLGPGTVVFAGAQLQPDVIVGRHAIINTGATVDHDGRLGDYAHVAPGVNLAGGVHVGEGTLVGIGATAIQGARIGRWATIGAGAVVLDAVADGVTAVGVPARRTGGSTP